MFLKRNPLLTGMVTAFGVKMMELRFLAASSEALLPEAKAVRKIAFRRRCSWFSGGFKRRDFLSMSGRFPETRLGSVLFLTGGA